MHGAYLVLEKQLGFYNLPKRLLQINTMGGAINKPGMESTAAYPHRKLGYLGELQTYYDRESQGKTAEQIVREIQGMLTGNGITAH